ncbi:hypothetical protein ACFPFV_08030 [Salinicoccus siamensis]|uniref:hypothetical protein n=1 Tax=Salinicoccus siamensis TaxID=381830 RepID=UPI00361594F7
MPILPLLLISVPCFKKLNLFQYKKIIKHESPPTYFCRLGEICFLFLQINQLLLIFQLIET